jgi:YjjG family noncanonical pyrimidine nucleotidase
MYKHLFFDLDNTVWDFELNSYHAMRDVYREYGLPGEAYDDFFRIYTLHNDRLWELYRNNAIAKQELAGQRFELTFQDSGITHIDGLEFNKRYLGLMPGQTRLCDGAHEVLTRLARRFELHIITNGFIEVQYKKLENSDLQKYFKKVFISEEIKSPKPSREIFEHALKSTNARKKESLMIGDSWEVDILGAMQVGIDQVHYAPGTENTGFSQEETTQIAFSSTKTYRINSLSGIYEILKIFPIF